MHFQSTVLGWGQDERAERPSRLERARTTHSTHAHAHARTHRAGHTPAPTAEATRTRSTPARTPARTHTRTSSHATARRQSPRHLADAAGRARDAAATVARGRPVRMASCMPNPVPAEGRGRVSVSLRFVLCPPQQPAVCPVCFSAGRGDRARARGVREWCECAAATTQPPHHPPRSAFPAWPPTRPPPPLLPRLPCLPGAPRCSPLRAGRLVPFFTSPPLTPRLQRRLARGQHQPQPRTVAVAAARAERAYLVAVRRPQPTASSPPTTTLLVSTAVQLTVYS